jgi:hypothetical protein
MRGQKMLEGNSQIQHCRNPMTKIQNPKQYDLEDRTFEFAKNIALYPKQLPRNASN